MIRGRNKDEDKADATELVNLRSRSRDRGHIAPEPSKENKRNAGKKEDDEPSDLTGDYGNICILLLLYTLQGVPMGLSAAIPMLLQEKGASLTELGTFSFCTWPFSLKLLWAPIVDSVFSSRVGLRKSWLIPSQFLIGFAMIAAAPYIDTFLGDAETPPDVQSLTALFFLFFFLCATQDIAVDGWALTLLQKRNISYASTTNGIGQCLGNALSFVGYLVLSHYGLVELSGFMMAWGFLFIAVTIGIAIFKKESHSPGVSEVSEAYSQMLLVLRNPVVHQLFLVLLTTKAGWAITDSLTSVKVQAAGMPKEHLAYMGVAMTPISILAPGIVSKWTANGRPMDLFMRLVIPRLLVGLFTTSVIYYAPSPWPSEELPWLFYGMILVLFAVQTFISTAMFVAQMAFFARISDPVIGGTYMTMLNTVANLGSKWPNSLIFFLVEWSTVYTSPSTEETPRVIEKDGYYPWAVISFLFGIGWFLSFRGLVDRLQTRPVCDWKVSVANRN